MKGKTKRCERDGYIRQVWIMASRTSLLILMLVSVRRWFKMNWSLSADHLTTILLLCFVVIVLLEAEGQSRVRVDKEMRVT